jgi:hypothetical protein
MAWILIICFVVLAFIVLAMLKSKQGGSQGSIGFPYQPAKVLFSVAERSFLGVVDQAVGPDYRVFGKVRVADVAMVTPGLGKSARQGALNRIASKHFDFIICRASDLSVLCAIELNDKSHSSKRAQDRDDLLVNVCQTISLPLLQVPAKQVYSQQELRTQFLAAISQPQSASAVGT